MRTVWALAPGAVAAVVTILVTPLAIRLAHHLKAYDVPGGRKKHGGSIPRLGGIAIVSSIAVAVIPGLIFLSGKGLRNLSQTELIGFGVATLIIFGLGIVDDVRGLSASPKFVVQFLAASVMVALGWQFTALRIPLGDGRFLLGEVGASLLTVLWIVGVTNAINLIDGLDGLAAGIVAIIASSLAVLAALQGSVETAVVTGGIAGASLGFLWHNWRPARIYMGDSGSLTLGFILAGVTLGFRPSIKASAAVAILVPLLALGLPVFDTLLVMWYRFVRGHPRTNRIARMFHGDRKHLHHLLLATDIDRSKVLFTLFGLALAFCALALLVAASGSLALGVGFLVVEFGVVLLIRRAGLAAEARRLADERLAALPEESEDQATHEGSRSDASPERANAR